MDISPATRKNVDRWRRMPVRLIVLAGRKKAGKDVLLRRMKRRALPFRHYRIAEAPVQIAKLLELPPGRAVLQKLFGVNALLYPILGESAFKRRVARLIDRERPRLAVVEAIRTKEEYDEFVKKRGGILVGVWAPARLRYERALRDSARKKGEKRDEGTMSFRNFLKRETLPIERDIDLIIRRADFLIENRDNNLRAFQGRVDDVLRAIGVLRRARR